MINLLPPNTHPEYYYFQRFTYDYHLVFKCARETNSFASPSEAAYTKRESQVRDFMHLLQKEFGLRQREMMFFAATEFGDENRGHIHVLLSFDKLREKGKTTIIRRANDLMPSLVDSVRKKIFQNRVKVGHEVVRIGNNDSDRLLSYICKGEGGRDCIKESSIDQKLTIRDACKREVGYEYKHCFFSNWIKADALH